MKKRIFVLNGHPAETSLNGAFARTYAKAAQAAGHEVRIMHLHDMDFDMNFGRAGYSNPKPLEPALETLLDNITWSEHFVMTSPMWWGGLPGKLKGMFDRAFLPGLTFDTRVPAGRMPKPMLGGRSARVILTSDTPRWFLALMYRSPIMRQIRRHILKFVGITPSKFAYFSGASDAKPKQIEKWLRKVASLGDAAA